MCIYNIYIYMYIYIYTGIYYYIYNITIHILYIFTYIDEGRSSKLALSEGGSRGNIES